ncbi:MAG: class I SAM-dependent methyltransferase [Lysinibacillus sp.]
MKNQVIAVYDQLAGIYERSIDTKGLYNIAYERPAMLEQLPASLKGKRILDAGCAAGWYTEQLILRGASVVATDISPEMVNATKRRVGNQAEAVCLDLEEELPFEDDAFDFIVSSLLLHYLKDWHQTFKEFKRVLKKNGVLLFSVHHPFTDVALLQDFRYHSTELIIDHWNKEGKIYDVPFYRRPLQTILNETLSYFSIEKVIEPKPTLLFKEQAPEKYEKLLNRPTFLIVKAIQRD